MLDELQSRSGHRVLRCDGHLLASREDPIREAGRWVNSNRERFSGRGSVIVLGVGCGYHLELLAQEPGIKTVIGLDYDAAIINWVKARLTNVPNINSNLQLLDLESAFATSEVKHAIAGSYSVLKYFPSLFTNSSGYTAAFEFLLGRNLAGAKFIFAQRPEFRNDNLILKEVEGQPISLKNIDVKSSTAAAVGIWKALGELVS